VDSDSGNHSGFHLYFMFKILLVGDCWHWKKFDSVKIRRSHFYIPLLV